jgi:hypothetical protein
MNIFFCDAKNNYNNIKIRISRIFHISNNIEIIIIAYCDWGVCFIIKKCFKLIIALVSLLGLLSPQFRAPKWYICQSVIVQNPSISKLGTHFHTWKGCHSYQVPYMWLYFPAYNTFGEPISFTFEIIAMNSTSLLDDSILKFLYIFFVSSQYPEEIILYS